MPLLVDESVNEFVGEHSSVLLRVYAIRKDVSILEAAVSEKFGIFAGRRLVVVEEYAQTADPTDAIPVHETRRSVLEVVMIMKIDAVELKQ